MIVYDTFADVIIVIIVIDVIIPYAFILYIIFIILNFFPGKSVEKNFSFAMTTWV